MSREIIWRNITATGSLVAMLKVRDLSNLSVTFVSMAWPTIRSLRLPENIRWCREIRTCQYLWEYGTGKFASGTLISFAHQPDGATGYFEGLVYGATRYFNEGFQRSQGLFWSTNIAFTGPSRQIFLSDLRTFVFSYILQSNAKGGLGSKF